MTAHNVHPSIRENGLADGCPRCAEHAERPFDGLDDGNLENLMDRIVDKSDSRSTNEAMAMGKVADAVVKATTLLRLGMGNRWELP